MPTLLEEPFAFGLIGKIIDGFKIEKDALGRRLREALERQAAGTDTTFHLAYIYALLDGETVETLAPPPIALVAGPGEAPPKRFHKRFPAGEFALWQVDPRDDGVAFDVAFGSWGELLLQGPDQDVSLGLTLPEGDEATVLRGSDGRIYCIPASLDAFEVFDEEQRAQLDLAAGIELGNCRVTLLTDVGALAGRGAVATRGAAVVRGAAATGVLRQRAEQLPPAAPPRHAVRRLHAVQRLHVAQQRCAAPRSEHHMRTGTTNSARFKQTN
ncbi:MAG: hypothetical protein HWD60_05060 [Defluviicoccus sp.]|nr:MAG: hypothetical protein HWD60_05060 [Defluviicoccus sp.]